MIKVHVKKDGHFLKEITVSGHAFYQDFGNDIVCAATSSIVITSINAIACLEKESITFVKEEAYIKILVINNTKTTQSLLENMLELLKSLEKQYPKNIKLEL